MFEEYTKVLNKNPIFGYHSKFIELKSDSLSEAGKINYFWLYLITYCIWWKRKNGPHVATYSAQTKME